MTKLQERLRTIDREICLLRHAEAVLGWDQETHLPARGVEERAEQLALLRGLIHERVTSPEVAEALAAWEEKGPPGFERGGGAGPTAAPGGDGTDGRGGPLREDTPFYGAGPGPGCGPSGPGGPSHGAVPGGSPRENLAGGTPDIQGAFYRAWERRHRRAVRLPRSLVERMAGTTARGQARWAEARRKNDFSLFLPLLEEIIVLTRETAERIGYREHPYDALLDEYEPWMTTGETDRLFSRLREHLAPLVRRIAESPVRPRPLPAACFPEAAQKAFGRKVLEAMGFPWDRGRLDRSTHPFTSSLGADDVRLTTRYDDGDFRVSFFGMVHEGGHGLYELGFGDQVRGTILGEGASLGIHESQSRIWENCIARSLPFWRGWYPALRDHFPGVFDSLPLDHFHRAVNTVEPSPIRVEADEVTYSLHIVLRFLLEKDLVTGDLPPRDLPDAWNGLSRELLGLTPKTDAQGVLQDIHWSLGAIGYFPTYALGNLYAAQFYAALRRDLPDMDDRLSRRDMAPILEWLRIRIHLPGASRTAADLVRDATGAPLDPSFFIRYLSEKYGELYGL